MLLFRCLECLKVFQENQDGESDSGLKRPMCPRCAEEIDLEMVGEYETPSQGGMADATGEPY